MAITINGGSGTSTIEGQTNGVKVDATGALTVPSGTTAQRPSSPVVGMVRYNTTESRYESYNGTEWVILSTQLYPYAVEYLVIAGGGGGADNIAGGGGAGGYRCSVSGEQSGGASSPESPLSVVPGTSYTVTVGAGGASQDSFNQSGFSGNDSVFGSITSIGGGGGGNNQGAYSGGSGGGAGYNGSLTGANGTTGQGTKGGNCGGSSNFGGGGGGGAGAGGSNSTSGVGGAGGAGLSSSITGTSVARGGGGGGGGWNGSAGGTATAGGGAGGPGTNGASAGVAGTVNTGGGGGGGGYWDPGTGRNGGSGIVIIRYLGAQRGSGGTVTSSGGYTIHTFTTSGTYTA